MVLTTWLAGPVARFLDADGDTPEARRAEVIEHAALPGEEVEDLALRHITRGAAWLILFGMAFAVGALILLPVSLLAAQPVQDLAFDIAAWVVFFPFWMAAVHIVKMLVIWYLPERRWNPRSRRWRAALLARTPEYVLAAVATASAATWW
ncbi:hypothetical protein ACQPZK_22880 [Micromonospora sp. CA-249363]|uniref:hypothetical protein n=1 Tax=Micromonospora sp. CA-249363 TaxID=3239963 RepID=UPI003D8FC7A7